MKKLTSADLPTRTSPTILQSSLNLLEHEPTDTHSLIFWYIFNNIFRRKNKTKLTSLNLLLMKRLTSADLPTRTSPTRTTLQSCLNSLKRCLTLPILCNWSTLTNFWKTLKNRWKTCQITRLHFTESEWLLITTQQHQGVLQCSGTKLNKRAPASDAAGRRSNQAGRGALCGVSLYQR